MSIFLPVTYFYSHPFSQICLESIASRYNEIERQAFLKTHSERKTHLMPHIERTHSGKSAVSASTLKSLGVMQGKEMGALLKEAERIAIFSNLHDEESILKILQSGPLWEQFEKGKT